MFAHLAGARHAALRQKAEKSGYGSGSFPLLQPEQVQETVPPQKEIIMEAMMDKRVISNEIFWAKRRVLFTAKNFFFTKEDETICVDKVPMNEITYVGRVFGDLRTAEVKEYSSNTTAKSKRSAGQMESIVLWDTKKNITPGSENAPKHNKNQAAFEFHTLENGYNSGRSYCLRANSEEEADRWVEEMRKCSRKAMASSEAARAKSSVALLRKKLKFLYQSRMFQLLVAAVIISSFVCNVVAAELLPEDGSSTDRLLLILDIVFTAIFTVELLVNFFITGFYAFWKDGWNILDLFVVLVSIVSLSVSRIPAFNLLRLVRVFRVVRLFKWFHSLREIINALTHAITPVFSSFLIMLIVTCIYAVIAVNLFGEKSPEYFHNFSQSLFTMFQIMTGDAWASVVRPLFNDDGSVDHWVALFFISYVLVTGTVLINIVVAVLLDEFITAVSQERETRANRKAEKEHTTVQKLAGALDPLLATLSHFQTSEDLGKRINSLFTVLDSDENERLTFAELRDGLKKLKVFPPIHFSHEDFEIITEHRTLCSADGEFTPEEFDFMMRRQLKLYVQRHMANAMFEADATNSNTRSILFVLKLLTIEIDEVKQSQYKLLGVGEADSMFLTAGGMASVTSSTSGAQQLMSNRKLMSPMQRIEQHEENINRDVIALHRKVDQGFLSMEKRVNKSFDAILTLLGATDQVKADVQQPLSSGGNSLPITTQKRSLNNPPKPQVARPAGFTMSLENLASIGPGQFAPPAVADDKPERDSGSIVQHADPVVSAEDGGGFGAPQGSDTAWLMAFTGPAEVDPKQPTDRKEARGNGNASPPQLRNELVFADGIKEENEPGEQSGDGGGGVMMVGLKPYRSQRSESHTSLKHRAGSGIKRTGSDAKTKEGEDGRQRMMTKRENSVKGRRGQRGSLTRSDGEGERGGDKDRGGARGLQHVSSMRSNEKSEASSRSHYSPHPPPAVGLRPGRAGSDAAVEPTGDIVWPRRASDERESSAEGSAGVDSTMFKVSWFVLPARFWDRPQSAGYRAQCQGCSRCCHGVGGVSVMLTNRKFFYLVAESGSSTASEIREVFTPMSVPREPLDANGQSDMESGLRSRALALLGQHELQHETEVHPTSYEDIPLGDGLHSMRCFVASCSESQCGSALEGQITAKAALYCKERKGTLLQLDEVTQAVVSFANESRATQRQSRPP